ncbi:hypothetical protein K523DRAFT_383658, partial [Schizophyllum commune Tattone D]
MDIVPILADAEDWPLWCLRVTDTLNRDDLTSVVTRHEKSPPPKITTSPLGRSKHTNPNRRETWSWHNSHALSMIRDHLSSPLALELWEYEHASNVWQKLVEKFEQTNTGEMVVAELIKIFHAKLIEGDNGDISPQAMHAHCQRVKQLVTQLTTLGFPLNLNLIPLILLASLPTSDKWKVVCSAISSSGTKANPLTVSS